MSGPPSSTSVTPACAGAHTRNVTPASCTTAPSRASPIRNLVAQFFLEADVDALGLDAEPQPPKEAHQMVGQPDECESADEVAPPVIVDEAEFGQEDHRDGDPVAQAVLAREHVERLPPGEG